MSKSNKNQAKVKTKNSNRRRQSVNLTAAVQKTPNVYSDSNVSQIKSWVSKCKTQKAAFDILERRLGITRKHLSRLNKRYGFWLPYGDTETIETFSESGKLIDKQVLPKEPPLFDITSIPCASSSSGDMNASMESDNLVTLAEVISLLKVDESKWKVKSFSVTGPNKAGKYTWRVSFEKIANTPDSIGGTILADFKKDMLSRAGVVFAPVRAKVEEASTHSGCNLLEIDIFDAHIGKLAWGVSTGQDYDLKIAKRLFRDTLYDLVKKGFAAGRVDKILFVVGNDFLTCDNENNTTTAQTPQEVDGRFPKIFKEARELLVESIEYLNTFADVDVIVLPGNHEVNSMFHLGDALECWFHNVGGVSIDNTPRPRKYYRFGQNLICYAHGDKIKHDKLPMIAAVESPDWSQCKFREIHLGHLHHERVTEENGVKVRIIPSITATDNYHSVNGYVGGIRTAQAFLYEYSTGLKVIIYSDPIQG